MISFLTQENFNYCRNINWA